jgi:predicted phage terminase large subunit-like protein
MVEGESGLLAICPDHERPVYLPSKRRLDWPTGATSLIFTADEPERLRGKQHERLWADEVGAWRYAEAWTQAMLGLRLGTDPRVVATTTPRPTPLIRELMADPATSVTRGSTYDNAANLAPAFLQTIIRRYEGTRLGRQELLAELLTDVDGALWTHAMLDAHRVQVAPDMARIVVAIDPAVTSGEQADETGIVVAGKGVDGHGYVLADLTCRLSPDGWARRAVNAYHAYEADRLIAETNNGGELVKQTIHTVDRRVAYRAVTATRGKRVRAEPIAALYEQGMVHHVGTLPALEDQMTAFVPDNYDGSPDRVDALVWALTDLMVTGAGPWRAI